VLPHPGSLHDADDARQEIARGDMIAGITGFPRGHGAFEQVGAPLVLTTR